MMVEAGSSAHDVKAAMQWMASHFGIERQETAVSLNSLITTSYEGHEFQTEVLEVPGVGVDSGLSQELLHYVRNIKPGTDHAAINRELDRIEKNPGPYPLWVAAIGAGAACASFGFLAGGRWPELVVIFFSVVLAFLLQRFLLRRHYNKFGVWMVASIVAAGTYMLLSVGVETAFHLPHGYHGGIIAATLFLVPGVPMVTSIAEIVNQEYSLGLTRAGFAATLVVAVGSSLWLLIQIFHWNVQGGRTYELILPVLVSLQALATFVAATGFAVTFETPLVTALYAGGVAAVANVLRLHFLTDSLGRTLAAGTTALLMGLLAALISRLTHRSRPTIIAPALLVLIPGADLYRALSTLGTSDMGDTGQAVASVSLIVMAIGLGFAISLLATDKTWRKN